jgi:hypothetical protein
VPRGPGGTHTENLEATADLPADLLETLPHGVEGLAGGEQVAAGDDTAASSSPERLGRLIAGESGLVNHR